MTNKTDNVTSLFGKSQKNHSKQTADSDSSSPAPTPDAMIAFAGSLAIAQWDGNTVTESVVTSLESLQTDAPKRKSVFKVVSPPEKKEPPSPVEIEDWPEDKRR